MCFQEGNRQENRWRKERDRHRLWWRSVRGNVCTERLNRPGVALPYFPHSSFVAVDDPDVSDSRVPEKIHANTRGIEDGCTVYTIYYRLLNSRCNL